MDVWVERHRDDDVLVVFDSFKTARLDRSHRDFAARIAQRLTWADKLVSVRPGRMPVILSPTACATLLHPLLLEFSGARVHSKSSPLAGKLGQQMFDSRLTLVDDGTLSSRPGGAFDHEGVPTQRTVLVRNGVVTGFYYDLQTAAQSGTQSTGNGRRDMLAPPRPQPGNIVIEPGTTSLEAMLQQAGDGLLVDLLMGSQSNGCTARDVFTHGAAGLQDRARAHRGLCQRCGAGRQPLRDAARRASHWRHRHLVGRYVRALLAHRRHERFDLEGRERRSILGLYSRTLRSPLALLRFFFNMSTGVATWTHTPVAVQKLIDIAPGRAILKPVLNESARHWHLADEMNDSPQAAHKRSSVLPAGNGPLMFRLPNPPSFNGSRLWRERKERRSTGKNKRSFVVQPHSTLLTLGGEMSNRLFAALSGLMIVSMILSACAPAATPVPPTAAPAAPAPAQPTQPPPPTNTPVPTKPPAPTATPKPKVVRVTFQQEPDSLNPLYTQHVVCVRRARPVPDHRAAHLQRKERADPLDRQRDPEQGEWRHLGGRQGHHLQAARRRQVVRRRSP